MKGFIYWLLKHSFFMKLAELISREAGIIIRKRGEEKFLKWRFNMRDIRVLGGPFGGMNYIYPLSRDTIYIPKILGAYESEMHPFVEAICKRGYDTIINIGAAEGYYAVGLAIRNSNTMIHAYEANERTRDDLVRNIDLNNVAARVVVHGKMTLEEMKAIQLNESTLVLCDCDGQEVPLIDPEKFKGLRKCDLLVELHEYEISGPTISELFQQRFSQSHDMVFRNLRKRDMRPYEVIPEFKDLKIIEKEALLSEGRQFSIGWVFCHVK